MPRLFVLWVLIVGCIPQHLVDRAKDRDGDGFMAREVGGNDCDDANAAIHPDAPELCGDGLDNDCDGVIDDDGIGASTWYPDRDGDGYGVDEPFTACSQPPNTVASLANGIDCDDDDPDVNPGAREVCGDGVDNDCDSVIDDDGLYAFYWYPDLDGDGYYADDRITACSQPEGYGPLLGEPDCDDDDPDVNPGASELCGDGIDNNCDGSIDIDGADAPPWYPDLDGDGWTGPDVVVRCAQPEKHLAAPSALDDCDDLDGSIHPGATEIWYDGIDQNCDEWDDFDQDLDGYRSAEHATDGDDCDDLDEHVNPGETEICNNGKDDDCDGTPNHCRLTGTHTAASLASSTISMTGGSLDFGDQVLVSDMNDDGVPDIVIGGFTGRIYVFAGPLPVSSTSATRLASISAVCTGNPSFFHAAVGDHNGDGVADLSVGIGHGQRVYTFNGPVQGDMTCDSHSTVLSHAADFSQFGRRVFAIPDIDGDNRDELLVSTNGSFAPEWGQDMYVFAGPLESGDADTQRAARWRGIHEGGTDGTGYQALYTTLTPGVPSIVVSSHGDEDYVGHVAAMPMSATGGVRSLTDYTIITGLHAGFREGISLAAGDLYGTGDTLLALGSVGHGSAGPTGPGRVYLVPGPFNGPQRTLAAATTHIDGVTTNQVGSDLVVLDLDGDGQDDLFIGTSDGTGYLFYGPLPTGDVLASSADLILTDVNRWAAAAADLDSDGADDIVLISNDQRRIYTIHGSGW